MRWVSIDPAKGIAGLAYWDDERLVGTSFIKARGSKGKHYLGESILDSFYQAWYAALASQEKIFMERGSGGRMNIVNAQGWMRGYIACMAESMGAAHEEINVSVWRRCIKEGFDVSWPKNSDRCKALAIKLVKKKFKMDVTHPDEADAVLVGVAAMRMGMAI